MSYGLISVEALRDQYQHSDVVVVDCRFSLSDGTQGENQYAESHIPGAYYLHLNRDLSGVPGKHGGRHPLPDTDVFVSKLESLGISNDTLVVAYDDHQMAFASRLWWLLRYLGHERVNVLDGGFSAWCHAQQDTSSETFVLPLKGKLNVNIQTDRVVDINKVKTIAHSEDTVLIDSRESERFLGLNEPIDPIAGHIDGAVNYPWQTVTDDAGFFLDEHYQKQRWGTHLAAQELVVYCGSGVTACVNVLSLAESGRDDAKLYVGSWSDWVSYL